MNAPVIMTELAELIPNEGELASRPPTREELKEAPKAYFAEARRTLNQQPDWRIPIHPEGTPKFNFFPNFTPRTTNERTIHNLIQKLAIYYFYTDHDDYLDKLANLMIVRVLEASLSRLT